jgi:hypothetical protein
MKQSVSEKYSIAQTEPSELDLHPSIVVEEK